MKKGKEIWNKQQCTKIEDNLKRNNNKSARQAMKGMKTKKQGRTTTIQSKAGPRADNIPTEMVQAGGEAMVNALTKIGNKIWRAGEWPTSWTQSLIIILPKKEIYGWVRTITLSANIPSQQIYSEVLLNKLKLKAEKIIAQAGFRAGRSTAEQIFNLRIICDKYLQSQNDLYHVFVDLKRDFDRVWHATSWSTMRKYRPCKTTLQGNQRKPQTRKTARELGSQNWWMNKV